MGAVPFIHAGQTCRVEQCADVAAGNGADAGRRVGHAEGGCANLRDLAAKGIGKDCQPVDVRGLALVGGHAKGRVALQMLDRLISLARGEADIRGRDIILEIDKGLRALTGAMPVADLPCRKRPPGLVRRFHRGCLGVADGEPGRLHRRAAGLQAVGDRLFGVEHTIAGTGIEAGFMDRCRCEAEQPVIPSKLAAGLRMQMHRRRQPAGHGQKVAIHVERVIKNRARTFIDRRDLDTCQMLRAAGDGHGMAAQNLDSGRAHSLHQPALKVAPQIDDNHMRAGAVKRQRRAVGIVIIGEDDRAIAGDNAIAVDIGPYRAGQHHARQIIAGKDERAFMRALCQNSLRGPHFPQALAWQMRWRRGHMIGHALGQRQEVVVHIAEDGGPRQQCHVIHRRQLGNHAGDPACRRGAIDRHIGLAKQPAAKFILLVRKDHPRPAAGGLQRRHQAGSAAAGNQHVAMRVEAFIAVGVVMIVSDPAKPGGAPDHMLIGHPHGGRPHEGLVIEPRREEGLKRRIDRADIAFQRWKAILALGVKPVMKVHLGRAKIGFGMRTAPHPHQRVRLFRSGGEDATRPVIFERSADKMDIVRQQGRGQRVAFIALIGASVEGEAERLAAIDPAAGGASQQLWWRGAGEQACPRHDTVSFFARDLWAGFDAASAAVSRRQLAAWAALPAFEAGPLPIG